MNEGKGKGAFSGALRLAPSPMVFAMFFSLGGRDRSSDGFLQEASSVNIPPRHDTNNMTIYFTTDCFLVMIDIGVESPVRFVASSLFLSLRCDDTMRFCSCHHAIGEMGEGMSSMCTHTLQGRAVTSAPQVIGLRSQFLLQSQASREA